MHQEIPKNKYILYYLTWRKEIIPSTEMKREIEFVVKIK